MNLLYVIGCIPAILFFGMNAKGFFKIFVFFVKTFDLMVCNKIFLSGILPSDVGILLQKYSKNLKFLNVDFFEISTIIMVSLRFFNVIFEETERAINALKCRGISFRTWHLVRNIKVIFLLIGNVIEFAFSGNEEIAMALEARGYGYFNEFGDEVKINFNFLEITVLSLSFFLLGVTLFCNFLTIHMTKI